ncbi:DUF4367 domain-containing protein [Tepidibacillus infernus]|uniref:DUF4367 domain-containing protein n=1 Tax=Tepidibacillus infernus TaxID=1806172 RepID=UPI003B689111
MKKKDVNIDHLMKEIIEEELKNSPPPLVSKEETWENIRHMLYSQNSNSLKFQKRMKRISVVIISVFILAAFFYQSPNASAFDWISKFFLKAQGTITDLTGKIGQPISSNSNGPKPEAQVLNKQIKVEDMSLTEAQKMIDGFTINVPKKVPPGFELSYVSVIRVGDRKSNEIKLHYKNEQQTFSIQEIFVKDQMGYSFGVDNEDTVIKEVNINGIKGTMFTFKDGTKKIIWVHQDVQFLIESQLSDHEMLEIAKSI